MRLTVGIALLVTAVAPRSGYAATGASQTRQTVEDLQELIAPASRLELRCDLGILSTRRIGDGRAGIDVEIATRPDYWYSVGVAEIVTTTVTTTSRSDGTTITTVAQDDVVGVSARFFKRFGPLVLSAGLADSAGGAGIELRALDDRLRFEVLATSGRLSDLNASPRVRVGGSAQWRFLYVQAGLLDVFADPVANAYLGIGVRWRDPDLLGTAWWLRH